MPKKKSSLEIVKHNLVNIAGIIIAVGVIYGAISWALAYYTTTEIHNSDMADVTNDLDILYNDFKNHKHEE